jgi:hypothetical protein
VNACLVGDPVGVGLVLLVLNVGEPGGLLLAFVDARARRESGASDGDCGERIANNSLLL